MKCGVSPSPQTVVDNRVAGTGTVVFTTNFAGGSFWFSKNGPWGDGVTDWVGTITNTQNIVTVQYVNNIPVAARANINTAGTFTNSPSGCALIFAISIGAAFGISRIVEQNLLTVSPGVIEAARAAGASPLYIIRTVLLPEALGPLILGYTFVFIVLVDMTAVGGYIGGGGIGNFAIQYGYRQFNPVVTWAAVLVVIIFVQLIQFFGNALARKIMRR